MRVYCVLLVAYPKKFREHYEKQLVQVFRDSFRDAYHRHGMPGEIDLWLHTFADLLVTALNEHIMERSKFMFSPKVILWCGLASVVGGLFWMISGIATSEGPLVMGFVLGLGGMVGLYSRQMGQGRKLGVAGFALGIVGTVLVLSPFWWAVADINPEINPVGAAPPLLMLSLGTVILGVGIVLLGITSLRGKSFHRWRGLPLGMGLLLTIQGMAFWLFYYVPMSQGLNPWKQWILIGESVIYPAEPVRRLLGVLLGLGWVGLGIMLMTEADARVAQSPPASADAR